jgi:kynureninase
MQDPLAPTDALFTRFRAGLGERLHFAAHSHHWWPDAAREAHLAAFDLAAEHADQKWEPIWDETLPEFRGHVARVLGGTGEADVALAPNVHELLLRLVSGLEAARPGRGPLRLISSDAEFHSFTRQARRWVEADLAVWTQVPAEPFESFPERFAQALAGAPHDLAYVSHVFFDSGYVFREVFDVLRQARDETVCAIDGYHGFMALPTDLRAVAERCFYLAGGYKYAMAGEGCCFMHCPPGIIERPVTTGWFAGFAALSAEQSDRVPYAKDGQRFLGATFDASPYFRFNAVQRVLSEHGWDVPRIHARVQVLQERFLEAVAAGRAGDLVLERLVPGIDAPERGHFLTFRLPNASERQAALLDAGIVTDARGDRLRFGFGLYQDTDDVDRLIARLGAL